MENLGWVAGSPVVPVGCTRLEVNKKTWQPQAKTGTLFREVHGAD